MAALGNETIFRRVMRISAAFEDALSSISCENDTHERDRTHQDALNDDLERFKLWTGSLGALHPPSDPKSLEYRLRNASQIAGRVHELLSGLENNLLRAALIDTHTPTGAADGRAPRDFAPDEEMLLELFDLSEEPECEASRICDAVADSIGRLIKISMLIGKSVARDRYVRAEASITERFDDHYDVGHVKEKFRLGTARPWLLDRLGKAVTKRRQYIKYSREHRQRIAHVPTSTLAVGAAAPPEPLTVLPPQSEVPSKANTLALSTPSRPSLILTTGSTVRPVELPDVEEPIEDDRSVSTAVTTVYEEDSPNPLRVPKLDTFAKPGTPFACPYCPTLQSFQSQSSWKRHVYADLRAYICTSRECSMTMFEDKRAWASHEMEKHRRQWFCQLCAYETSTSPDKLTDHLRQSHGNELDEDEIQLMPLVSSKPMSEIDAQQCQFCDWTKTLRPANPDVPPKSPITVNQERFLRHLAHHLEQVALFAIPRDVPQGEDSSAPASQGSHGARRGSQDSRLSLEVSLPSDSDQQESGANFGGTPDHILTTHVLHEHERSVPQENALLSWSLDSASDVTPEEPTAVTVQDNSASIASEADICEACEKLDPRRWYCNVCACVFCNQCWDDQKVHQAKPLGSHVLPHEKTNKNIVEKIKGVLMRNLSEEEIEHAFSANLDTAWFGIANEGNEGLLLRDYGGYTKLVGDLRLKAGTLASLSSVGDERLYPRLVSFVGETGAGKSALIKLLIDLKSEDHMHVTTPVVGTVGNYVPMSEDVHLYLDPESSESQSPILFADCEGLSGGEREPVGAMVRRELGLWKPTATAGQRQSRAIHTSERELIWAHSALHRSREYAVTNLYPRLLHNFSDVVVFVYRNPRVIEGVMERLIEWGHNALESSSNHPVLPHAIMVLNACEYDSPQELWEVDKATHQLVGSVSRVVYHNATFRRIAQYWRERNRQIESIQDLISCYYGSVRVVHIPELGRPNLMIDQVKKLSHQIRWATKEAREQKAKLRMLLDANELQSYMQMAFDHFSQNVDTSLGYTEALPTKTLVPNSFGDNILQLALKVMQCWEPLADGAAIFTKLSRIIASYIMLDATRKLTRGTAEKVFSMYVEHLDIALQSFCVSHWPCEFVNKKGERCVNVEKGHDAKGHQMSSGKMLSAGRYQSSFTFKTEQRNFQARTLETLEWFLKNLHDSTKDLGMTEMQAAAKLHREFGLPQFIETVSRGDPKAFVSHKICFCCLFELSPEHVLPCGHAICTLCLKTYGRMHLDRYVEISGCPMESKAHHFQRALRVDLKPAVRGIRSLSLDGGGVRGIVQLEILSNLVRELGGRVNIQSFFDLIVGTGTGGIIALGLTTRMWTVQESIDKFEKLCKQGFSPRQGLEVPILRNIASSSMQSKYRTLPLQHALIEAFPDEQYLFGGQHTDPDLNKVKVAVTASTDSGGGVVLANYNRQCAEKLPYHFQRPDDPHAELKIWEAARATSASPAHFKPMVHEASRMTYFDGGMHYNNPIQVAHSERRLIWPNQRDEEPDIVVSIGTMFSNKREAKAPSRLTSLLDRVRNTLDAEIRWKEFINNERPKEADRTRYVRLNPEWQGDLPRFDDVKELRHLQEQTRRLIQDDPIYERLAQRLVATCFYFDVLGDVKSNDHNDTVEVTGDLQCRELPGPEIAELGKFIERKASSGRGSGARHSHNDRTTIVSLRPPPDDTGPEQNVTNRDYSMLYDGRPIPDQRVPKGLAYRESEITGF